MKNKYIFENKTLVFFQWNQSMEQQTISGIFFCQPMVKSTVFLSMSEPTNRKSVRQLLSLELSNIGLRVDIRQSILNCFMTCSLNSSAI